MSDLGEQGERLAEEFLQKRGFISIARRFKTPRWGEIDLVMRDGETTVFVEVKTRGSDSQLFGGPLGALNRRKLKALQRAAQYYLTSQGFGQEAGLKNNWVTNGFMSKEAFKTIAPFLDAANVDLKGFTDEFYRENCGGRLEPVLETLKRMKAEKIWIEVTTLAIPTLNDTEEVFGKIAGFIKEELGAETPWHVSRFSGAISWKLQHLPDTPIETLEKAYEIGKEAGLKYVYTGNVPGLDSEDTFCSKCGAKMIERTGYRIERYDKDGRCTKCGQGLDLILE